MSNIPPNVHISNHPCLRAKLSQLRSHTTNAKETNALVNEMALILGTEALSALKVTYSGIDQSPLGFDFPVETISPTSIALVPIMRAGLAMLDALQTILPCPVSIHHLGLYRDKASLEPVEYYNNLPQAKRGDTSTAASLALLLDPVIATGGTAVAAIQTLREWGVDKIIVISVLGAVPGVTRAAEEWPEGTEMWIGGLDEQLTDQGMIKPGLGDIGDRLFLTLGK